MTAIVRLSGLHATNAVADWLGSRTGLPIIFLSFGFHRSTDPAQDQLLDFFDFPAEHSVHRKTSNPIESTFSTVRLRTRVTKGPGSKGSRAGDGVQAHRGGQRTLALRQQPAPGRLVRVGAKFEKGVPSSGQMRSR